ncbi:hypothetical protein V7056_19950 [Bacillus sp. JJ664]
MGILSNKTNLLLYSGIGIIILSLFFPWTSMGSEVANLWGIDKYGVFSLTPAIIALFYVKKQMYLVILGLTILALIVSFIQFYNIAATLYISAPDINFSKHVVNKIFYIHILGCIFTLLICLFISIDKFIKNK